MMVRKVICALDTGDLSEAVATVRRLSDHVGAFKVGHALTLPHGLDVVKAIQDAGGSRVFLDLKFHDIPNSVALAVCQAANYNIWMMTLHTVGGPAMMSAAVLEARNCPQEQAPLLVGVSVLTSLDQHVLSDHLGVQRTLEEQMVYLSQLGIDCGLDGVVCSPHEVAAVRSRIGRSGIIVTPGIRPPNFDSHDQRRVGSAGQALEDGADYLVIGRALTGSHDVEETLANLGLLETESAP
ncbi:MAG: orotidine-5'-phosphate decarboxylase [Fimbriimonadaceae bacterium]|nr:orotidine-5'-phosphate decarboxylase [Chthonomonadaceae bacterium]MCO5295955.1 orotidine-5'-phosphate decarboxylase [Fimbriimonadaceae bacterium]